MSREAVELGIGDGSGEYYGADVGKSFIVGGCTREFIGCYW
jgi:hypothetical protein